MTNDYDPNYIPVKNFMIVGSKVVLSNSDGKILLLKRSDKVNMAGYWSFPGGALEKNEDIYTSAKREVMEETKSRIDNLFPFAIYTHLDGDNSAVVAGFMSQDSVDSIDLNWEHDDYVWVKPDKALDYKLTPHCKYFVNKYLELTKDFPWK
ncbi:NUDIX hydrolase [Candidatus Woesebacteria bacterium]|nr:MAG: NUDIX hydrolase [Candidatus Woesebacteria bacterium]